MDSPRAILAQALKFGGLILSCAGSLAIIRTGEKNLFYAVMMPIGLACWYIGARNLNRIIDAHKAPPNESPSHNSGTLK